MKTLQIRHTSGSGWEAVPDAMQTAQLVLVFADSEYFHTEACHADLRARFPAAHLLGCSSSGSVLGTSISDGDTVATAVLFEQGRVRLAVADLDDTGGTGAAAASLAARLQADDLRHILVLSDGLQVNGSELATGLNKSGIPVTGGLAGDGTRFGKTWVMADAPAASGRIAALGIYGNVAVSTGCFAGWQEFGAERVVTRSENNVVYEIDGQPALALYRKYLGDQAADLPGSGLRFPLSVRANKEEHALTRTLLAVDEANQSLTFAGDVPQGHLCRLMRTDLDSLIEHAGLAAEAARPGPSAGSGLCLVVSCVGRRLVLGQLTEEELEIVQENLGDRTAITGFYSYGELAPFSDVLQCQLHNQTMTLTTLYE